MKKKRSFKLKTRELEQSQRQLQVSQAIHTSLIECFQKGGGRLDRRLFECPLTITKVNISADLKNVNCFILPFNTEYTPDQIIEALEESNHVIRKFIAQKVNLKYSPEIKFYYDVGFENLHEVEKLLKQDK